MSDLLEGFADNVGPAGLAGAAMGGPLGWASLGLSAVSGIFGSRSEKKQRKLQLEQMRQAQRQFDEQMDHSVRRRVEDAKRAGIHPLFALGASSGASPTLSSPQFERGTARQDALTDMARTLGMAQARKDEATAQLLLAQRDRLVQNAGSRGRDVAAQQDAAGTVDTFGIPDTAYRGKVEVMPARIMSPRKGDVGKESGIGPFKRERVDPDGQVVELFSEDAQMDEANQWYIGTQRARWHTEWKIWDFNRGTGRRAHRAKKWILEHTAPSKRRQVLRRLNKMQRDQRRRAGRYPVGFRQWQQYRHRGGTMSWRRFKSVGGY